MNAKLLSLLALAAVLCGCASPIVNLTPAQLPQNTSGIYTLTMNARLQANQYVHGTLRAYIVIEGAEHEMQASSYNDEMFSYDYAMPADRMAGKYYYILRFQEAGGDGIVRDRVTYSSLYAFNALNQYVVTMEETRGPVGAVISIVGHGFGKYDTVIIGGVNVPTAVYSGEALTFVVPSLAAGQQYDVALLTTGNKVFPVGSFLVDQSALSVRPDSLQMASGEKRTLIFGLPRPAPAGGVTVSVLTDVPSSVITPDTVVIAEGASTQSEQVQGGQPGSGTLHFSAPGFDEVVVPILVGPVPEAPAPEAAAPAATPAPTPTPAAPVPAADSAPAAPAAAPAAAAPAPAAAAVHGS